MACLFFRKTDNPSYLIWGGGGGILHPPLFRIFRHAKNRNPENSSSQDPEEEEITKEGLMVFR